MGTYNLQIVGSVAAYTSTTVYFTLYVTQVCASTVITSTAISSYTYDVDSGTTDTIATLAWTQSQSGCAAITYVVKNADGTTADSTVVYMSGSAIMVTTSSAAKVGTYNLQIIASVGSYTSTVEYFTLYVT